MIGEVFPGGAPALAIRVALRLTALSIAALAVATEFAVMPSPAAVVEPL